MLCYKIVKVIDGKFYSPYNHRATLQYSLNETTIPRIGKIFVYPTLKIAVQYANDDLLIDNILLCECGPMTKIKWIGNTDSIEYIKEFWDTWSPYGMKRIGIDCMPPDMPETYVTDWVKPIQLVNIEDVDCWNNDVKIDGQWLNYQKIEK